MIELANVGQRPGRFLKVCIVGAGAIGGVIGTRLAMAGHDVCALARGATLAALRKHGWRMRWAGQLHSAPARASDRPADLGGQDLVVVAVKAPSLPEVAPHIQPLLEPHTWVLPAMNGVPWWFGRGVPALEGMTLASVDPGGVVSRTIPFGQVIGCVVYVSASTSEPGLVEHNTGDKLVVGEPGGGGSERADRLAEALDQSDFDVKLSMNVRRDIWHKLWLNLTLNPVSALTGASTHRLLADPLVRDFCSAAMREASAVGARIGCAIDEQPEDCHATMLKLGSMKPSMLQDVEAGRVLELDAIIGAVHEIARRIDIATPNVDALLGVTRLFARVRGLYPA
ncbi:MAG TPA: 2-dehydropantoate 2-reductase [Burkholderiaceae bacterium]|nr:2-dehydropantoate 2-reductase [Burkholderiaceae bacterium]